MLKKFLIHLWSLRHQFVKYAVVGVSGFVLDMVSLIFLKEIIGLWPVYAVIINQAFLLTYNFSLNKYWSFKNKEFCKKQVLRYLILASFNYTFSVIIMYILNHKFGFDYRIVRLASIAVMVSWNFLLYKHWVYAQKSYSHLAGNMPLDSN